MAPAMNCDMWNNPIIQENISKLIIGNIECKNRNEISDVLRDIADRLDDGYVCGMTNSGVWWESEGDEEYTDI